MMHAVDQNNAVNIYECYFEDLEIIEPLSEPSAKIVQCFRHPIENPAFKVRT